MRTFLRLLFEVDMKKIIILALLLLGLCSCAKKQEEHTHEFTKKDIADSYISSTATCTEGTVYFYSCSCGEKGDETFSDNIPAGHVLSGGVCTKCGYVAEAEVDEPITEEPIIEEPIIDKPIEAPEIDDPIFDIILDSVPVVEKNELNIQKTDEASYTIVKAECVTEEGNAEGEASKIFIPNNDGIYRFEISNLADGTSPTLSITDSNGNEIAGITNGKNGDGCVARLGAGTDYTITLKGLQGAYTLKRWNQKSAENVSEYTRVSDFFEFEDQINLYTFIPKLDGVYSFGLESCDSGMAFAISLTEGDTNLVRTDKIAVGEEIHKELEAGNAYTLKATQGVNLGGYTISIGIQKPTVDISSYSAVNDEVTYNGQRNRYLFTSQTSGDISFKLTETDGERHGAGISIYDSEGTPLVQRGYCIEGDTVTLKNAVEGECYTIDVTYYMMPTSYKLVCGQ